MNFALMTYHAQNLFRLTILSRHVKYLDSIHGFCNDDSTSLIFAEATYELWFVSKNRTSILTRVLKVKSDIPGSIPGSYWKTRTS